jgi:hypothetical protein
MLTSCGVPLVKRKLSQVVKGKSQVQMREGQGQVNESKSFVKRSLEM